MSMVYFPRLQRDEKVHWTVSQHIEHRGKAITDKKPTAANKCAVTVAHSLLCQMSISRAFPATKEAITAILSKAFCGEEAEKRWNCGLGHQQGKTVCFPIATQTQGEPGAL